MIDYLAPAYLVQKFLNNKVLGVVISLALISILVMAIGVVRKNLKESQERATFFWVLGLAALLCAWTFFRPLALTVLPDAFIGLFALWALFHLRQSVSVAIVLPITLLIYFLFFSPIRLDIEFDNRYWTSLKPFIYLVIFFGITGLRVRWPIRQIAYGVVIAYPLLLVWNIALWWIRDGFFMTRPNFLFENNFEVPFLLYCFVIIAFIYRDKDLRIYLLVAISVLLTGSRSGLASFMAVSVFYLFSLDRKKILWVGAAICSVLGYLVFIRGVASFNAGRIDQIDRLKTFIGLLSFYDFRFSEILRYPLGVGIYQKIPLGICNKMEGYADWFTGNYFNCDPIMLQSFVARALYQFGIYVLILIPALYLYELTKRMGFYMAVLLLTPILLTAFSVGGFSNGLSFGGLLLAILAFNQTSGIKQLEHGASFKSNNESVISLPMLSIITINRNNEIGLEKTISSLRMQSNQDFEWIFIDGNSTDSSLALANQFARASDELISEPDGGIYNAMNKGAMLAHGKCILLLNSGDIFANENCVNCIQNVFKKNVDLVLFGFSVRGVLRMPKPIWWRFWNLPTSHQAIVYRASLLKDHRFDESYRFLADFEHFLRIHPERLKVSLVNQLLVVNEAYGTDQHLQAVAQEYRLALLIHGWPLFSAQFLAWIKAAYLKQVLK